MNKILIIGQAPPAVEQEYPYDTTMLYDWFKEVNISKEQAQDMFEFEAVFDKFPGYGENGHLKPTKEQMDSHWKVLEEKIQLTDKVLLLGNVAKEYFLSKPKTWSCDIKVCYLLHPSKRNFAAYQKSKEYILKKLKEFLNA